MDGQGRIIIPKEWRKGIEEVKIINMGDRLMIKPKKNEKLGDLGSINADVESSWDDWHAVKEELLGERL